MAESAWAFDMRAFERGLSRALEGTRREGAEVLKTQARGVVRTLFDITPPARSTRDTATTARQRGLASVKRDVNRVIYPVRRVHPSQVVDPAAVIEARRSARTGRVGRRGQRFAVERAKYRNELARRQAEVGKLSAGWAPAARQLGVRIPSWIDRHRGEGTGGTVETDERSIRIVLINSTLYARSIGDLQRRVQWALDEQGARMERAARRALHRGLRQGGFEVSE